MNPLELEHIQRGAKSLAQMLRMAAGQQVPAAEKKRRALILVPPYAELVWQGEKTLIIKSKPFKISDEELYLADRDFIYGVIVLSKMKPISIPEFRRRVKEHRISEEDRKKFWPKSRRLYAYRVEKLERYDKPRSWQYPQGAQTLVLEPQFKRAPTSDQLEGLTEAQISSLYMVLSLSRGFSKLAPAVVQQALRIMRPEGATRALLTSLSTLGSALVKDYEDAIAKLRPNETREEAGVDIENLFIIAERLVTQLHRTRQFLPAKTHILALSEDAITYLEGFLALEDAFAHEGSTLQKSYPTPVDVVYRRDEVGELVGTTVLFLDTVEKYERPRGSLPTLKMPDPAFNIARLRDGKATGVLSRLQRTTRTDQRQFLINEMGNIPTDGQYVWGVVTLGEAVEYKDLAALSDEALSGIDRFSREEFSPESPIFYMPMKLVATYDPPLKLKKPLQSRRYGPIISLPEDLAKSELTTGDVPLAQPDQLESKPWLSFRGLTPDELKKLSDKDLLDLYIQAKKVLDTVFAEGQTSAGGGVSREDVVNALAFIISEIKSRGLENEAAGLTTSEAKPQGDLEAAMLESWIAKAGPTDHYAPIHPGSSGELEPLALEEFLSHLHKEFVLRAPFVYVVGSIANNGVTRNDVDVLIRGPLDPATSHIVKFRLGRMLPPELAQRVSFHGGPIDSDGIQSGAVGPFTANLPIYDLVVRRREDYDTIIEMRDADVPLEEILLVKQDVFLKLPRREQPYPGVLQHHFRGKSVHADLRISSGEDYLIGYTLADQRPGKVPKPKSMDDARRIAGGFSVKGSSWNKPMLAPNRLYASTKAPEPSQWLNVEDEFQPGTVGATRFEKGYMVITARPRVSWGERTSYYHEYFLEKDPKFFGLLTFRLLVSEAGTPTDPEVEAGRQMPKGVPFWTCMFTKSLLPSVLKKRAVEVERIPPQGWAYLPPGLKQVVPKRFQYWLPSDEKERRQIRDALVEDGFFNDQNIKLVDREFHRVVIKYHLYRAAEEPGESGTPTSGLPAQFTQKAAAGTAPFTLTWQRWKGQMVIRAAPSRQAFHFFVKRPANLVEDFQLQGDPTTGGRLTAVYTSTDGPKADGLMTFEGDVPPNESVNGIVLNPTKDTPSVMHIMARGEVEFLEDGIAFKKFRLKGTKLPEGLAGVIVLRPETGETGEGSIWIWERSAGVGQPIQRSDATTGVTSEAGRSHKHGHRFKIDAAGNGQTTSTIISPKAERKADPHVHQIENFTVKSTKGHPHDKPGGHTHTLPAGVKKEERVETVTFADGSTFSDVQVWNPKDIKPGDDKEHDRERLRPLALYMPMKVANRPQNEFRSNEMDRLYAEWATPEVLKIGLVVEPKWNGFRISLQKDSRGRMVALSEDLWERKTKPANFLTTLPGLRDELSGLPGPFILDGEFMALNEAGDPVPRRELADFRSPSGAADTNVRVHLFDILYHPDKGNVVAQIETARRALLDAFIDGRKLTRLVLTPHRLVHTKKELQDAIEWAKKIPGSEGAMLKSAQATVTLRETDSMAKLKGIRELQGIVWDMHPVKGSPGVYNYMYAVGPVSKEEAQNWAEIVEINGKIYVKAGKSFNTKVAAKVGDSINIEVTEILWDEADATKKRLRGFTPTVVDMAQRPSTLDEVRQMLAPEEIKRSAGDVTDAIAKQASRQSLRVELVKQFLAEERYVLGVVLVPDEYDSQGDIYDAESIRKAAYYFMEHARSLGYQHERTLPEQQIKILESYVAPVDMMIEGHKIKKGTWLLAARVLDDTLWQAVKEGRLTGWSIEGTAIAAQLD